MKSSSLRGRDEHCHQRVHSPAWVPAWGLTSTCDVAIFQDTARQRMESEDQKGEPFAKDSTGPNRQNTAWRCSLQTHLPLSLRMLFPQLFQSLQMWSWG